MDFLKALGMSILAVFAPIKMIAISVGVLIFADMILGIWAAKKRGEEITSAGMRRTISKMAVYQIALLTGYLMQTYLIGDLIPVVNLVGAVIGFTEFKSLLENASEITGTNFKDVILKLGSKNDNP